MKYCAILEQLSRAFHLVVFQSLYLFTFVLFHSCFTIALFTLCCCINRPLPCSLIATFILPIWVYDLALPYLSIYFSIKPLLPLSIRFCLHPSLFKCWLFSPVYDAEYFLSLPCLLLYLCAALHNAIFLPIHPFVHPISSCFCTTIEWKIEYISIQWEKHYAFNVTVWRYK